MASFKEYARYDDIRPFVSFKQSLLYAAQYHPDMDAYRYKSGEEIVCVTFSQFLSQVKALTASLDVFGYSGKHIAIVAENSYKWVLTFQTLMCGNFVTVPVDGALPFDEICNILKFSDSEVVFISKSHEDKFKTAHKKGELPFIKLIVCMDGDPQMESSAYPTLTRLLSDGSMRIDSGNTSFDDCEIDPYALKLLVFTSGTTGTSKGVMLSSHSIGSVIYWGMRTSRIWERSLSILPYTHTYASVCDILVSTHCIITMCINESLRAIAANLKIYKPVFMFTVPLVAENLYKKIWSTVENSGKEKAFRTLLSISDGLRKIGIDMRRKLFHSIHDVFGGELVKIVCGGAPLRADMIKFFDQIGIILCNGYGITECSPLISVHRDKYNDPRSAGSILECNEIKIDNPNEDGEGEICVRGDVVMLGYYKNEKATNDVFDDDGYFHTGDYGKVENAQLYITGRKKNLIILKNGKNVYPEEIEGYVSAISCVAEVVVYSNRNEDGEEISLGAEIFFDEAIVKELDKNARHALIKSEIDRINKPLPLYKHILNVRIRASEFEKTTSRKIRRSDVGQDAEEI